MDADALLLIEVDGIPEVVAREAATVLERAAATTAARSSEAATGAERDALWAARRAALPALARLRPTTIVEDATVPRSQIAAMLDLVAELARKHDLTISVVGHAGDGNLHPTILVRQERPGGDGARARGHRRALRRRRCASAAR